MMKLILGVFANLFHLLLNPKGWNQYLKSLAVEPDYHLLNLNWEEYRFHDGVRALLLQTLVIVPLLAGVLTIIILPLSGVTKPYSLVFSFLLALGYALSATLTTSLLVNFGAAQVYALTLGVGMGLLAEDPTYIYFSYAVPAGLAGLVLINISKPKENISSFKNNLIGFFSGVVVVGLVLTAWFFVFSGRVINEHLTRFGEAQLEEQEILFLLFFILLIVTVVLYFALLLRTHNRKTARKRLFLGAMIPAAVAALNGTLFLSSQPLTLEYAFTAGLGGGTLFAILISLSWILYKRTRLNATALVASAFTTGLGWIFLGPMLAPGFVFNRGLFIGATLLIGLGLTFNVWFPVFSYPLLLIFNYGLYVLDIRDRYHSFRFFQYHPVFWFEKVKFRWFGLNQYLVKMAKYQPKRTYEKMIVIAQTNQRWAVRKALLDLSYQELLDCNGLEEIAELKPALIHIPDETLAFVNQFLRFAGDINIALAYQSPYHVRAALVRVRDDLITVERSLMMADKKRLFRFLAVTSHWSTLIDQRLTEMAAKEPDLGEIDNPYVCGIPLNEKQELFVGRVDIFERIERLILSEQRPPLLLYGQRRMGKTSLLLNLGRILPDTIIPMYLDGQALASVLDLSELLYSIVQQMSLAASRYRNIVLPKISSDQLKESPFLTYLEWIIDLDLYLVEHHKIALWLIDEFETLNHWTEKKAVNIQELLNIFRHVVQHHPNIKVMFSGAHHLSEMETWAGGLVNTQVIKIGCLKRDEAEKLIQHPTKNFQLVYPQDALNWILELTGGHPHLIQLFCFELILLKNEQQREQRLNVVLTDLEEAYHRATLSGEFFFIDIYQNQIKPEMKPAFVFLAKKTDNQTGLSRAGWQQGFDGDLEETIRVGLQRDLIQKDKVGSYRFQIDWIRRWFRDRSGV